MRKQKKIFVTNDDKELYYDLFEDWSLIESSFAQQYGIRLRKEQMSWDEFCSLLSGLKSDTPLGTIVSIRSETNKEILKNFTMEQKKIRNQWANRKSNKVNDMEKYNHDMKMFEKMFASLAKVGGNDEH